ncbi:MAG: hypothetical protein ACI4L8_03300 [Candidatus Fimadaptatus sp.]
MTDSAEKALSCAASRRMVGYMFAGIGDGAAQNVTFTDMQLPVLAEGGVMLT